MAWLSVVLLIFLALLILGVIFCCLLWLALETPTSWHLPRFVFAASSGHLNETAVPKFTRRGLMSNYWFLD